jgi:threonine dehydratase
VVAAEPLAANDFAQSMRAGYIVEGDANPDTVADGARVKCVGVNNWAVLRHGIAEVVEVPEASIQEAIRLLFQLANLKVEPTGALAFGAVLTAREQFHGQRVGCIVSGGNVDLAVYVAMLQEGRAIAT